jgi:hypothetical protein
VYVPRQLVEDVRNRNQLADLNRDYSKQIRLVPIRNDEPLVRAYLHHFLLNASDTSEFRPHIESNYLKQQFATVKILNGLGDDEQWASMLAPQEYQELLERVDLDFAPSNPEFFRTDETVKLDLYLKNIDKLLIKVFEINTENYYRKFSSEIDTNVSLDGLVPNFEMSYSYDQPPARRFRKSFTFEQLRDRGVYVIDFIARGKSSRALIRKGRLQMIGQTTAAGQVFTVFDQSKEIVEDATLWIAGKRYKPVESGRILIPFSTQPGTAKAIIQHGDFSSLQSFEHLAENYKFDIAFVVDREMLTRSQAAKILLRPTLRIAGGNRVPVSVLENPQMVVTTVNHDGISSTKTFSDLKLSDTEETICEFVVPPRISQLALKFTAQLKNISRGQEEKFSVQRQFLINQIDKSSIIQDVHLAPSKDGYYLEVLGKTGEPRPQQALRLSLKMLGFKDPVITDLQSDDTGKIKLGALNDVESIEVAVAGGSKKNWFLPTNDQTYPASIHAASDQPIKIVAPADLTRVERDRISLYSVHGGSIVDDYFKSVSINSGVININGLPVGDYILRLKYRSETNRATFTAISLKITEGRKIGNAVVGDHRVLELRSRAPVQIATAEADKEKIRIQLANPQSSTRIHIVGTRYQPAFNAFSVLQHVGGIEPWSYQPPVRRSSYVEGRKIGDEYQYILDRKFATKFPGNMLTRPSLLLNPWTDKTTDNKLQIANKGNEFKRSGNLPDSKSERQRRQTIGEASNQDFANLDFVGDNAWFLANLKPDENGLVTIDRSDLGKAQHLRIIAIDNTSVSQRNLDLTLETIRPRDSRLAIALDPRSHFSQRKMMGQLSPGDQLVIADIVSAKFQHYDDLTDIYVLLTTLNPDSALTKFEFVLDWPELGDDEKKKLYSEYACHELNFFLYKKDADFFEKVVRVHLQHKKEKTFLDRWLLKENLDAYVSPWKYSKLNTVEKILLSQRLENRAADIIRNLSDQYALRPTDRSEFDILYDTAINGLWFENGNIAADEIRNNGRRKSDKRLGRSFQEIQERLSDAENTEEAEVDSLAFGSGLGGGGGRRGRARGGLQPAPGAATEFALGEPKESDAFYGIPGQDAELVQRSPKGANAGAGAESGSLELYGDFSREKLLDLRNNSAALFRRLPKTQEWIENHYYELRPEQQNSDLVLPNRFWRDYASHQDGTFLSNYFPEAHRNFTEMMFVLSVLDLPWKSPEQELDYVDNRLEFNATSPVILFHQQVQDAMIERGNTTVLISENFFQANDRFRFEDGLQVDKFISDDFRVHELYGGQVVITNPTSTPRAVDLLIQIPQGAVSCNGSQDTKTVQLDLEAFSTQTFEYFFYFPVAGKFSHYPAHVSAEDKVLAVADQTAFIVSDQPAKMDQFSWEYISQNGTSEEVLEFLNRENVLRLNLERIAFRMQDIDFFRRVIDTLRNRYVYNRTLWAYSIKHNEKAAIREFLTQTDEISSQCGPYFESDLLLVDPVERNWYQHREYWPLVNARTHQLGPQRKILNPDFFNQYQQLMSVLSHQSGLDAHSHLVVSYYMLLQDRIEQALQHFDAINPTEVNSKVQYAYCDAYLDMYREKPEAASQKAKKWADYPVLHWQQRFENIIAQVEEIDGNRVKAVDDDDQVQKQTELASKSQSFEFKVESDRVKLSYRNLNQVTANYYDMDIELLFSRRPFAQDDLDGFSLIRPNFSQKVMLEKPGIEGGSHQFNLPDELKNKNVLVEIVAGDQAKSQPYFAHSIDVQIVENYGQLQVFSESNGQPLSTVYVKVYARKTDGSVRFLKDGYTDLRGRFDYMSQSNHSLDNIERLSLLLMSPNHGTVVRQVYPPKE